MQVLTKIDALIRANRSMIGLTTPEEYRAMSALKEIIKSDKHVNPQSKKQAQLIAWGCFGGFEMLEPGNELPKELIRGKQPIIDPAQAIGAMLEFNRHECVVFVAKSMHAFFNNPRVVRGLLDLSFAFNHTSHTLILLSPVLQLPNELEAHVSLVDFPLPDESELGHVLGNVAQASPDDQLTEDDKTALVNAMKGLTLDDSLSALKQALILGGGTLNGKCLDIVLGEKEQIVRKSGVLQYFHSTTDYNDVGGLNEIKQYLKEAELSFTPEAKAFGVEPARGILAAGVPGTGKSLVAKACAGGKYPKPLLKLSISELLASGGGVVGQGQAKLQQALKTIEAVAPCVVWIDEIEKAFGGGGELDGGTRKDMLSDLLTWMQESLSPVFVVATANDAQSLPVELVRRFDEKFFVDLPGPRARAEIFRIHLSKRGRKPDDYDMSMLVNLSKGFTGAEIEIVVKRGLRKAMLADSTLNSGWLKLSLEEIKPISTTMTAQLDYYRQWDARSADSDDPESNGSANAKGLGLRI